MFAISDCNKDNNVSQQSQSPLQTDEASAKYPQNEGGFVDKVEHRSLMGYSALFGLGK